MNLEVIGVGGAGCRIVDQLAERAGTGQADGRQVTTDDQRLDGAFVVDTFAFDTDPGALADLTAVPEDHRHRYGTASEGLDGDLRAGLDVGEAHVDELSRVIDQGSPSKAEAFLLVVGLGGATGGGTAPALAADIRELYGTPVYVVGTLPTNGEIERSEDAQAEVADGPASLQGPASGADTLSRPLAGRNALRTIDRLNGVADAIIPFDNEAYLRTDEGLAAGRPRLNDELIHRLATFFSLGDRAEGGEVRAEQTIDASDVDRTFGDETVLAALGYAEQEVDTAGDGSLLGLGLIGGNDEPDVDTSQAVSAVETVVRKAVRGKLTADCDRSAATGALLAVGGPPAWLNRRAIADGRSWLEGETAARTVRGGDVPDADAEAVFAVALLAGVRDVERIEELREAV
ncbi:MAG: cell division protein FtsZ [Halopenitus sp.]